MLLISQKLAADFEALKDMLAMMENRTMLKSLQTLQKLAVPPPAPLIDEAARQIQEFKENHPITVDSDDEEGHETTTDDAADALEANPKAVETLALAGGVSSDVFEQALNDLKDMLGKNHKEAIPPGISAQLVLALIRRSRSRT